jgi:CubicO group peptidase (beta-lactamase class C family)
MTDVAPDRQLVDPGDVGVDPEALDALMTRARREVDDGMLPSCQVAVAANGHLVAFETFGAAEPAGTYVIFSCTKAVVMGGVWLLLGDAELALDQRVSELIPEFATNGKDVVTLRQVLLHEGGFPTAPMKLLPPPSREERLEAFARWRLNWEPGTRFEYHPTSGHWVLAELIERTGGVDYRVFLRENVLDPLGLHDLRLGGPVAEQGAFNNLVSCGEPATNEELAAAFGLPESMIAGMEGEVTEAALLSFNRPELRELGVPGGGGVSTAAGLALYYQALMSNPNEMWDPATLHAGTREVHGTKHDPMFNNSSNRALGTVIAGEGRGAALRGFGHTASPRAFGHNGAGGQIAFADPDTGISFCYLTNGLDANVLREHRRTAGIASRAGVLGARAND